MRAQVKRADMVSGTAASVSDTTDNFFPHRILAIFKTA